jgi:predicted aconitase with swiveling domain
VGLIRGRVLVSGKAQGEVLVSDEPLSFWGGYNLHTGEIIDRQHPLSGKIAIERVLVIPFSRGSSTTTAVLLEAIRAGTAPVAILTTGVDLFFALASIIAEEMYAKTIPIITVDKEDFNSLKEGQWLDIHEDGTITTR